MKKPLLYYSLLLVLIVLIAIFLSKGDLASMRMPELFSLCALLIFYTVALSVVGEFKPADERYSIHRYIANRAAIIAGTGFLSVSLLYQLFNHRLDPLLLGALIAINLTKVVALAYCHYRK